MTTAVVLMSKIEARGLTDRIKRQSHDLAELLVMAQDREAWRALGYRSWADYAQVEFDYSRSRLYELLNEGRINRALDEGSTVTAREAKEVVRRVGQLADAEPEEIRDAVEQVRAEPITRSHFSDGYTAHADRYDEGGALYECRHCGRKGSIANLTKCLTVLRGEQDDWGA